MKEKIILIGGGGHCRSCIDVLEATGFYEIAGIVDKQELVGTSVFAYPIVGTDEDIPFAGINNYLISIGQIKSPDNRIRIYERLQKLSLNLPVIISPLAYVSPHATVGKGTIVMHGAVINAGAIIGENCIINSKALVEHDTQVGDFCHISTAAVLNGGVGVGPGTFIGSNATVNQMVEVPERCVIASGAVVRSDRMLESGHIYTGNPLKEKDV